MNPEKLSKLQAQVRIGGKGTARRKKKIIHRTATTDDKKLQSSLKKLSVNTIPGIEEVNMIKDDGTVIHFNNPKVQASLSANTFAISGQNETKQIADMLPGIWNQLGADSLTHLRRLASNVPAVGNKKGGVTESSGTTGIDDEDEEVPNLIENFDEPSKDEGIINKKDEAIIINKKDEVKEIKKEEKKEVKKEAAKEEKKEVKDEKVEEKDQ